MSNDKRIIILSLVLLAIVAASAYFFVFQKNFGTQTAAISTIKSKAEKFITDKMVAPGTQIEIKDISEENGLYKLSVDVDDQSRTAYVSKDGRNFFTQVFNMDEPQASPTGQASQSAVKKFIPEVELFVMSYCPYGLQMEKGILPVVDLLGSKIQFNLKFVDYAMHGEKEVQENLRQYCVQQQGLDKLSSYLKCFVKEGDSAVCLREAEISTTKLNSCTSATDAKFKITAKLNDQKLWDNKQFPPFDINKDDNAKYKVTGSPTLIINGISASGQRDPQSLLDLICSGFSAKPAECSQKLSSAPPSSGFGEGTGSNATSNCGN